MDHALHHAVADRIAASVGNGCVVLRDPACGGVQHLPLFVGTHAARDTRMCCADLLLVCGGRVRGIVEIEESGFLPTKICGKFFQAALADHYIHASQREGPMPFGENLLFVQVLDGFASRSKERSKRKQAELIESEIRKLLPLGGVGGYCLFFVNGPDDQKGIDAVVVALRKYLAEPGVVADRHACISAPADS